MNVKANPLSAIAAIAALFFAVNLASGAIFRSARVDLTEDGLYTLSEGTVEILEGLEEPIRMRLYVSLGELSDAPDLKSYAQRVRELLEEYASVSDGQIELDVIDPEPFSEDEDRATAFGLRGAPVSSAGDLVYFGLAATNSTDDEEVIRFFDRRREQFLEYDLTRLVHKLAHPERKKVAILSGLPIQGDPPNPMNPMDRPPPWHVDTMIRQLFELEHLDARATEIGEDVDVLVVAHPRNLPDPLLYAIDQYALSGRPLIVMVDPYAETQFVPQDPNNLAQALVADRGSNFGNLLETWGVGFDPERVAGDRTKAIRVQFRNQVMEYPLWLTLDGDNTADDDPIVSELKRINLGVPGFLTPLEGATTTFTPILETTEEAMKIERTAAQYGPDPRRMLIQYEPGGERLTLAARLTGPASTGFPGGLEGDDGDVAEGHLEEGELSAIVVADADFLADRFWVQVQSFLGQRIGRPTAQNGDFVVNMLEILSGGSELVSLRSRGAYNRPFDRVAEIRRQAEDRFRAEEERLENELKETERKLNDLQRQRDVDDASAMILTDEQREELQRFSEQRLETRKRLRDVRHQQAKDIEALGTRLKLINAGLIPAALVALALAVTFTRRPGRRP